MYRFDLLAEEKILKKDTASMHIGDDAMSGALYLTDRRLVFVGYVYGITFVNEKAFALKSLVDIRPARTLLILPNAMDVTCREAGDFRVIFSSWSGRDAWIAALRDQICQQS